MTSVKHPQQLVLSYAVLGRLPPVHEQHRNIQTVARLEVGIGRDVDFVNLHRLARHRCGTPDRCLHLLAQVTTRAGIDRELNHDACAPRHSAAIFSAAARGSGAAMIGRPTTMYVAPAASASAAASVRD